MKTVNDKGSIGVSQVIADLLSNDLYVFLPFDGASPVDLIVADKSMDVKRLQVKYRKAEKYESFTIPLSSVVNGVRIPISLSKIDGWAIFCPDTKKVYYVDKRQLPPLIKSFKLSIASNVKSWCKPATDYIDPFIFWKVK